jgi:hypothetical protein
MFLGCALRGLLFLIPDFLNQLFQVPDVEEQHLVGIADLLLASGQGMIGSRDSVPVMRDAFQCHRYAFEDPTWVTRFPTLSKRQIISF